MTLTKEKLDSRANCSFPLAMPRVKQEFNSAFKEENHEVEEEAEEEYQIAREEEEAEEEEGSDSEYVSDDEENVPLQPNAIPAEANISMEEGGDGVPIKKIRTVKKVFRCSLCDFFSFNRESTEQHIRIHNEPQNTKLYYCSTCKYSTRIKPYFDKHRKLHSNTIVRPFKCSYCPYQGRFRSHTRAHEMRHHTGEKPYVCNLCHKGFVEQHILSRHMRTAHTDERPYVCDICSRSYKQLNALRVHQRKHFDDAFICEFCQKRFSTIHQLQNHLNSHQDKTEACPVEGCDFKAINEERVTNHIKNFHKLRKCMYCDFESEDHKEFSRHRATHNKKIIRTYKCPHCTKTFANCHNMRKHMSVHTGIREFQCNKCSYNTQKKSFLIKHLDLHRLIETKPELISNFLKCDKCDFICENAKNLGVHKRIHVTVDDDKNLASNTIFTCSLCEVQLQTRDELVDHLLYEHSNFKTFKCHHCSYTTCVQSEMNMHLDFHEIQSNESADVHTCNQCGYLEVNHEVFFKHMGEHEKEATENAEKAKRSKSAEEEVVVARKPYKCPLCPSRLMTPGSLKYHIISHSGVHKGRRSLKSNKFPRPNDMDFSKILDDHETKVLLCNLCDFYTTNAGALSSHQKVHKMHESSFVANAPGQKRKRRANDESDESDLEEDEIEITPEDIDGEDDEDYNGGEVDPDQPRRRSHRRRRQTVMYTDPRNGLQRVIYAEEAEGMSFEGEDHQGQSPYSGEGDGQRVVYADREGEPRLLYAERDGEQRVVYAERGDARVEYAEREGEQPVEYSEREGEQRLEYSEREGEQRVVYDEGDREQRVVYSDAQGNGYAVRPEASSGLTSPGEEVFEEDNHHNLKIVEG